ncbi:unannotated protein [freshwater metagenome]|uniref:Unannotated protein n=1 Tax=freshwater metagenome TaxID=449393 RepID=A0A6J6XKD3_9ZZZZ
MHMQRTGAPAYVSAPRSRGNAGNAAHLRGILASRGPKSVPDPGEEYLRLVGSTDSWSILSEKEYVSEKCSSSTAGTHRNFCIGNLRTDACTTKLLHSANHTLEQLN